MFVNLIHMLRQELHNLDKDPQSSKLAMEALKSYVEVMDSKDLPRFLALVSKAKDIGEHTILIYKVVARTHGVRVVPHSGNIMSTILETLESTDAGSVVILNGCAKLVQSIATYAVDPTDCEDKKRGVIHFLKGKCTQPNSHMGLVMALAKQNAVVVDAYARLLMKAGLHILQDAVDEGNSEKVLSAIRMMNSLMKNVDPRSIFSELENVIEEMEKCQSDKLRPINIAAYECLLTAKRIVLGTGSELPWSYDGSNKVRITDSDEAYSTRSLDFDSFHETPFSGFQRSCENGSTGRSVNRRKLWQQLRRSNGEMSARQESPDNVRICSALTHSLEDQLEMNSRNGQKQSRKFLSPCSKFDLSSLASYDRNDSRYANEDSHGKECTSAESVEFQHGSEALSSPDNSHSQDVILPRETGFQKQNDSIALNVIHVDTDCFYVSSLQC